jgi:murein DD-endopeptidase MepM/ murein hydrolase activator NlpD
MVSQGQVVRAGDVIGHLDASGCQSNPHLHVQRNQPGYGPTLNFNVPCVNPQKGTPLEDGLVDDAVRDDL